MHRRGRVVVIGGGISGLAAAHALRGHGLQVTVLERADRVGGKIGGGEVAGVRVDTGAESVLTRRAEAVELMGELGLPLERPAALGARIYSRGALRRLPAHQTMGIPARISDLARSGIVSRRGVLRAARDRIWPATPPAGEVSIGDYVAARMGPEVAERLVEPLMSGVYAGRAAELSLAATMPGVAERARSTRSLAAVAGALAPKGARPSPPFATARGGLTRVVDALAERCEAQVLTGHTARALRREGTGWRVTVAPGDGAAPSRDMAADGVVLACPPADAARLLAEPAPDAAAALRAIPSASVAVVTLAYPAAALDAVPPLSGFLVPAPEGRAVKAVTFSSRKWPWLADALAAAHPTTPMAVLRCSIGRFGDGGALRRDDDELAALARRDLAQLCGLTAAPAQARVDRWQEALPQYTVGHADRVARVRAAVASRPGLAVCGAALDGVGIPACVGMARAAATDLLRQQGTVNGDTCASE